MSNKDTVRDFLLELRKASMMIHNNETALENTIKKYDMVFAGEKFHIVTSLEMRHSLKLLRGFECDNREFFEITMNCCDELGMRYEELSKAGDPNDSNYWMLTIALY